MDIDARLPSEAELSELFKIGRSTVQEALKRLAAQSLIRTEQGAWGGAFIKRLKYEDAYEQQITTSTLLLSMNADSSLKLLAKRVLHSNVHALRMLLSADLTFT